MKMSRERRRLRSWYNRAYIWIDEPRSMTSFEMSTRFIKDMSDSEKLYWIHEKEDEAELRLYLMPEGEWIDFEGLVPFLKKFDREFYNRYLVLM